jgi:hypothetical protein
MALSMPLSFRARCTPSTTGDVTQKIDQKLQFALQAIFTAMGPEAA